MDEIIGNSLIIMLGVFLILVPYCPISGGIAIGLGWAGISYAIEHAIEKRKQ